jgi:hypothetical protein
VGTPVGSLVAEKALMSRHQFTTYINCSLLQIITLVLKYSISKTYYISEQI